jgi:putative tricarboxylic transport membrane protein
MRIVWNAKMKSTLFLIVAGWLLACASVQAAYPTRRIEVVAAGNAGGGLDAAARALDNALHEAKLITQPMVINNMGGAAGDLAKAYVHNKKGDAHVLYVESNRMFQNKIVGTTQLDFDNFVPLARLITEYLVWAVVADAPQRSAKDILAQVKSDPTSVTFGVGSMPSNDYFNVLRPSMQHGVDYKKMRIAAFRGNLNIQLLGGHVQVISTTASEALEQVKAGKMRLIATSAPSPQGGELKGVPHWRGMGIDMQILNWRGLFMPAGTPRAVVAFWDERLGALMKTEAWKKVLAQYGWADAFADSAQFRRELVAEREVATRLLRELGFAK